jgi:pimeloyl-ACP methyl ester carboxylesterase
MVLELDEMSLHYQVIGTGQPLLLVHGFFGAGADWQHIFPDPPDGYCLIVPDLRGHGASTNASGVFTFRQCARDINVLLDHLQLDRIKAIGLSGGAITLLHMATATPARIESMVVVSGPPYFPDQARAIQRRSSEAMMSQLELSMMRERHRHGPEQIAQLFAHSRAFAESYDDVNFTPPYLSTITAETLIVFGDRDPLYPVALAMDLHAAIERSYLWVVPNGGHAPVFGDAAPAFASSALAFLRGEWSAADAA